MQTHKPAGALAIKPAYGNCKVANGSTSRSKKKKKKTSVWKFTLARTHARMLGQTTCAPTASVGYTESIRLYICECAVSGARCAAAGVGSTRCLSQH